MTTAISQDDFSLLIANELSKNGVDSKSLHIDKNDFAIRRKDERGQVLGTIFLSNLYAGYSNAKTDEQRKKIVDNSVKLWLVPLELESYEQAKSRIMPIVRARLFYPESPTASIEWGHPQIVISEHLTTLLALDSEDVIHALTHADFEQWNVTWNQAFEDAFHNLQKHLKIEWKVYENPENSEDCVYVFEGEDEYASSIHVFPSLFADLKVLGAPIIFTPAKKVVVVTGSDCLFGLEFAADIIDECEDWQDALVPEMLTLDDKLISFGCDLAPDHPLANRFNKIKLCTNARIYAQFFRQFEGGFDELVSAKRIVKYEVLQNSDGACFSEISFYADEGPLTLPLAEFVRIVTSSRDLFVPCEVFADVAGDQLIIINEYPPVYELVRPLSAEHLTALSQQ